MWRGVGVYATGAEGKKQIRPLGYNAHATAEALWSAGVEPPAAAATPLWLGAEHRPWRLIW